MERRDLDSLKTIVNQLPDIHASSFSIVGDPYFSFRLPLTDLSLLHLAAYFNFIECFRYLYEELHLILRHIGGHNYIPLHYALCAGSVDVSKYILNEDPEESTFHLIGINNFSILYCAAFSTKIELVQEVMKNGASINDPWVNQLELLKYQISIHNNDVFQLFYDQLNPDMKTNQYLYSLAMTAIHVFNSHAVEIIYNEEKCRDLINNDLNLFIKLIFAIAIADREEKFKNFLLKILSYAKDKELEPPPNLIESNQGLCHFACLYLDIDVAKALIKTPRFIINKLDNYNKAGPFSLIHTRETEKVVEMLELLIENGFDVNIRHDEKSPTILEYFALSPNKNYDAIELLIKYGADVNAKFSRGEKDFSLKQYVLEKSNDVRLKQIFEKEE